jgi:hypothetical protein
MAHRYKKFKEKLHVGTNARWAILISTCQTRKNKYKISKKYQPSKKILLLSLKGIKALQNYQLG